MKVLVVRIKKGEVAVAKKAVAFVGKGLAVFVGIEKGDGRLILNNMAEKVANVRVFEDQDGKMNYSVKDKGCQILCVPNFTLCANAENGRRPSFDNAMPYEQASKLFDNFIKMLSARDVAVESGQFGTCMDIKLDLDGPVNIILESDKGDKG